MFSKLTKQEAAVLQVLMESAARHITEARDADGNYVYCFRNAAPLCDMLSEVYGVVTQLARDVR